MRLKMLYALGALFRYCFCIFDLRQELACDTCSPCTLSSTACAIFTSITFCHKWWQSIMADALPVGNNSSDGKGNLPPERLRSPTVLEESVKTKIKITKTMISRFRTKKRLL